MSAGDGDGRSRYCPITRSAAITFTTPILHCIPEIGWIRPPSNQLALRVVAVAG